MSQTEGLDHATLAAQVLPLLKALALRSGGKATTSPAGGPVTSGLQDAQRVTSAVLVRRSVTAGWVQEHPDGLVLTRSGRTLLRKLYSARDGEASNAQPVLRRPAPAASALAPLVRPDESPLAWLRRRVDPATGDTMLSDAQFEAGERLRRDFHFAGMTPRVTASWNGMPQTRRERRGAPGAHIELSNSVMAAHERVVRALVAVGPPYIDLLIDILGFDKGLEDVEKQRQFPARSAKRFLQQGLTRLAFHYGFLKIPDVESDVRQRLRHWGADDYRPSIKTAE